MTIRSEPFSWASRVISMAVSLAVPKADLALMPLCESFWAISARRLEASLWRASSYWPSLSIETEEGKSGMAGTMWTRSSSAPSCLARPAAVSRAAWDGSLKSIGEGILVNVDIGSFRYLLLKFSRTRETDPQRLEPLRYRAV